MSTLNFKKRTLSLSTRINASDVNFGIFRPYVRIVKENKKKIPKILMLLPHSTTIEAIDVQKQISNDENPITCAKSIHCVIRIYLSYDNSQNNFELTEVELDREDELILGHFNDINSFLTVYCDDTKGNTLGTMTIAGYQNGGPIGKPPL